MLKYLTNYCTFQLSAETIKTPRPSKWTCCLLASWIFTGYLHSIQLKIINNLAKFTINLQSILFSHCRELFFGNHIKNKNDLNYLFKNITSFICSLKVIVVSSFDSSFADMQPIFAVDSLTEVVVLKLYLGNVAWGKQCISVSKMWI